jgi:hypothetical protein
MTLRNLPPRIALLSLTSVLGVACSSSPDGAVEIGAEASASTPGAPVVGLGGKCLDDRYDSTANGNKIQLYECNGTGAQEWRYSEKQLVGPGNKCLAVHDDDQRAGTVVDLFACDGTSAQTWSVKGTAVVSSGGLCLDVAGSDSANGTQIQVWTCNGGKNQEWTSAGFPAEGGSGSGSGSGGRDAGAKPAKDAAPDASEEAGHTSPGKDAGTPPVADCGMMPCFEDLYPQSPLLAAVPSGSPLDPNDRAIVSSLFDRSDGLRPSLLGGVVTSLSTGTGTFPLYSSGCSDPGYEVGIGQPSWAQNQPAGQTVHFPAGAVPENLSDAHISVFDTCPATYGVWDFWAAGKPANGKIDAQTGTRMPAYSVPAGCEANSQHYSECAVDGLRSAEGHGGFASAAVVRAQEILNGAINHAVLLDVMCTDDKNGIFPAVEVAPDTKCPYGGDSASPHGVYGQHFFLDMSESAIDALFASDEAWKKVYWVALARYGGYISDTGWVTTQSESNLGYLALGKPSPWATLAAKVGLTAHDGSWTVDFNPSSSAAWSTLYQNIHAIATTAPRPVAP